MRCATYNAICQQAPHHFRVLTQFSKRMVCHAQDEPFLHQSAFVHAMHSVDPPLLFHVSLQTVLPACKYQLLLAIMCTVCLLLQMEIASVMDASFRYLAGMQIKKQSTQGC